MGLDIYWCERINKKTDDDEIILRQRGLHSLIQFLDQYFDCSLDSTNNEKLELDEDILDAIRNELNIETFYDFSESDFEELKNSLDVIEEKLENFKSIYFQANW